MDDVFGFGAVVVGYDSDYDDYQNEAISNRVLAPAVHSRRRLFRHPHQSYHEMNLQTTVQTTPWKIRVKWEFQFADEYGCKFDFDVDFGIEDCCSILQ
jgi:hypothetical protein